LIEESPQKSIVHDQKIWKVQDPGSVSACILLKGELYFKVLNGPDPQEFTVPQDAIAEGTCLTLWGEYQDIKLSWLMKTPDSNEMHNSTLYLGFASGWESEYSEIKLGPFEYALNAVTVTYYGKVHNESSNVSLIAYSASDFVHFITPRNHSYSCPKTDTIRAGELELSLSNFAFQAFRVDDQDEENRFGPALQCHLDSDSNGSLFQINGVLGWILISVFGVMLLGAVLYVSLNFCRERMSFIRYRWLSSSGRESSVTATQ
jgi:hypothetical protein